MKNVFASILLLVAGAGAFTVVPSARSMETRLFAGDYEPLEGESKINLKIDLESEKVATLDE